MSISPAATLSIVSAMITPALLILACASLIGATASRLARRVDRVRSLRQDLRELDRTELSDLVEEIFRNGRRAVYLQWTLVLLYLALSFLVATSVMLGIDAVSHTGAWVPPILGLTAVILFLAAALVLILESRLGLASIRAEMKVSLHVVEKSR